jgi:hypothetical protein
LRRSGFLGGWNDIPAFEDKNLKQLRVPYRTRHLVQSIKDVVAIREEEAAARPEAPGLSFEAQLVFDPEHRRSMLPDDMLTSKMLTLFLGNQHATISTVRETLRVMDEQRLGPCFDAAFVIRGERVFDYNEGADGDRASTLSFEPSGTSRSIDTINPTFRFPSALVHQVGSLDALERFFLHVEDTFLSRNHLFRKDWCWVLSQAISPAAFHSLWVAALAAGARPGQRTEIASVRAFLEQVSAEPSLARTQLLFHPPNDRRRIASHAADIALRTVLESQPLASARILDLLEVPQEPRGHSTLSEYQLSVHLYARFESNERLWEHVRATLPMNDDSVEWLALSDLLQRNNVDLQAAYKPFFIGPADANPGNQQKEPVQRAG